MKTQNREIAILRKHMNMARLEAGKPARTENGHEGIPYLAAAILNPNEGGYETWLNTRWKVGRMKKCLLPQAEQRIINALVEICEGRS